MRRSACSGKAWGDGTATAISGDRSLKTSRCGRVGASERSGLARGDVTGGGGVCRLHGEARGAWWAWWQRTTAAALCSGEERRGRGEGEQRVRERREGHQGGSWHRGGVRGRLGNASVEAGGGGLPASACVIASAYWQRLKMARLPGGLGCLMGRLQVRPGKWPRYSLSL